MSESVASLPARVGSYTLLKRLGRGGMAEVYFAAHEGVAGFQRGVVVKRMLDDYKRDDGFVRMFVNEAKVAARLMHPNIVQVHELGEADGELFIAMEYIHGCNLGDLLRAELTRRGRPLSPATVAWVAREASRGLGHAHRQALADGTPTPIVHRDVSPHNIMVGFDGSVKVVDFGIAKPALEIGDETRTGELKGKVAYMSPEQLANQRPGPPADQWALGVVMHEMLTGKRLFKAASEWETALRVQSGEVEPPSLTNPEVPPALDAIVLRALARDPLARFADMAALQHAIDDWLGGRFGAEQLAVELVELFSPAEREAPDLSSACLPHGSESGGRGGAAPTSDARSVRARRRTHPLLVGIGLGAATLAVVVVMGLFGRWLRHLGRPETHATPPAAAAPPSPSSSPSGVTAAAPPSPPPIEVPATTPIATTPPAAHRASTNARHRHASAKKRRLPVFEDTHVHAVDE